MHPFYLFFFYLFTVDVRDALNMDLRSHMDWCVSRPRLEDLFPEATSADPGGSVFRSLKKYVALYLQRKAWTW